VCECEKKVDDDRDTYYDGTSILKNEKDTAVNVSLQTGHEKGR
jgi:hypothetical protein